MAAPILDYQPSLQDELMTGDEQDSSSFLWLYFCFLAFVFVRNCIDICIYTINHLFETSIWCCMKIEDDSSFVCNRNCKILFADCHSLCLLFSPSTSPPCGGAPHLLNGLSQGGHCKGCRASPSLSSSRYDKAHFFCW